MKNYLGHKHFPVLQKEIGHLAVEHKMTIIETQQVNLHFLASSLDKIEIIISIKASNQVKAWCLPMQTGAGALVSFCRNTDDIETLSAFFASIVIKSIRDNNRNHVTIHALPSLNMD